MNPLVYQHEHAFIYRLTDNVYHLYWDEKKVGVFRSVDTALQYLGNEFGIYD